MTGIERLRKLSKDLERCSLWVALVAGTEKDWNCNQYDDKTITDELLDISDQIEAEQDVETVRADAMRAWEWVRDHGGLDEVRKLARHVTKEEIELVALGKLRCLAGMRQGEAASIAEMVESIARRLMPDGMEWPRYEDGELVRFGDELPEFASTIYKDVKQIKFRSNGYVVIDNAGGSANVDVILKSGERAKRPAPKVLDADGAEIRVGDKLYDTETGCARIVRAINASGTVEFEGYEDRGWFTKFLTHRAPVLAADGRPLREGETVWGTKSGSYRLTSVHDGKVFARHVVGPFGTEVESAGGEGLYRLRAERLTHERPVVDTWERLEEDAEKYPCDYFGFDEEETCGKCPASGKNCEQTMARDLVRRCRALAERDA